MRFWRSEEVSAVTEMIQNSSAGSHQAQLGSSRNSSGVFQNYLCENEAYLPYCHGVKAVSCPAVKQVEVAFAHGSFHYVTQAAPVRLHVGGMGGRGNGYVEGYPGGGPGKQAAQEWVGLENLKKKSNYSVMLFMVRMRQIISKMFTTDTS